MSPLLGNALLIGGNFTVVSSQIYLAIIGQFNFARGAALSVTVLFPAAMLFIWKKRLEQRTTYATISGRPSGSSTSMRERGVVWTAWSFCVLITLNIAAVYLNILAGASTRLWRVNYTPTLDHFRSIFGAGKLELGSLVIYAYLASRNSSNQLHGCSGYVLAPEWLRNTVFTFQAIQHDPDLLSR